MFSKKSFTLIELLIVGSIISIIVGGITLNVTKNVGKGKDAQRLADLREIQTALETYKISFNTYPEAGTQGTDNYILNLTPDFIQTLPKDSSDLHNGVSGYIYNVTQDKKSYCFYIKDTVLEPNSQPDLVEPLIPNTWKICSGLEFANLTFNNMSTSTSMCINGASNYPLCNLCSPGYTYASSTCILAYCKNGAINPPLCNSCSSGYSLQDDGNCSKIFFSLTPPTILSGQSSHMFWMVEQNASCKINNENVQFTGIKVVYPATTTAYVMECTVPNIPPQKKTLDLSVIQFQQLK
jgi:type II secretory pathway pseudopilin PulG